VTGAFEKEFAIFAVAHNYKSQTEMLYAAFEALKRADRTSGQ